MKQYKTEYNWRLNMCKILMILSIAITLGMAQGCSTTEIEIETETETEEAGWYPTPPAQYIEYFDQ